MRDRKKKPLARLGIGDEGRKALEARLAEVERKRMEATGDPIKIEARGSDEPSEDLFADMPDVEDVEEEEDELLPPPKPTTSRRFAEKKPKRDPDDDALPRWVEVKGSDIHELLTHCQDNEHVLTDWERKFIDSIGEFVATKNGLTGKQYEKLQQVSARSDARVYDSARRAGMPASGRFA